jgi:hypothetical protein
MVLPANLRTTDEFHPRFTISHESMPIKFSDIFLVSALYNDGRNSGSVIVYNGDAGTRRLGSVLN